MRQGEKFHATTAAAEEISRSVISLGVWLVAAAVLLALAALIFARA